MKIKGSISFFLCLETILRKKLKKNEMIYYVLFDKNFFFHRFIFYFCCFSLFVVIYHRSAFTNEKRWPGLYIKSFLWISQGRYPLSSIDFLQGNLIFVQELLKKNNDNAHSILKAILSNFRWSYFVEEWR